FGRQQHSPLEFDTGEQSPVAEAQTHDALTQVLIANDGEVLARLRLSAAEAARVCNVTPRQLIYWTKKGLVKPSSNGDHDYDVFAMEKVIRIRQALEKGHSLEKAAQLVQREMGTLQAEAKRLDEMLPDALDDELRARLERLESRINELRRALPASLTIAPLRKAVAVLAQGVAWVSGTNGKTTTARMLADISRTAGWDPIHNRSGSNLDRGVAAALLAQSSWSAEPRGNFGLFEIDEASLPSAVGRLKPR